VLILQRSLKKKFRCGWNVCCPCGEWLVCIGQILS